MTQSRSGYDIGSVVMASNAMYYVNRNGSLVKFAARNKKGAWVAGDRPGDAELLDRIIEEAQEHVAARAKETNGDTPQLLPELRNDESGDGLSVGTEGS